MVTQEIFLCGEVSFVCFDPLHPSQQFFSYVGKGLPGLNQCLARINFVLSKDKT